MEGFVRQKTDFPFEILVYDDASPDGTADIIRKYEKEYPHLIKPVYQTVNQYSQGLRPGHQNRQRATGKYIAMCEGDDYWIDERKLQKQVDYMEAHPDCTFCFTNGYVAYEQQLQTERKIVPWDPNAVLKKDSFDYDAGELEKIGYIPTASFLFRRELEQLPVADGAFRGDGYLKLSAAAQGYAHFIDECTCAYRRGVSESATALWEKHPEKYAKQCDSFILLFESMREATGHRYDPVFHMRQCQWEITKAFSLEDYDALRAIAKSGRLQYLKEGNFYSRTNYWAKCRMPRLFHGVRKLGKQIVKTLNR